MTRVPRLSDSLTFSASSRQQITSKKLVASCHSPLLRSCQRRLTATPSRALAWPLGVNRSSGSRVMLPTIVMLLPDIFCLPSYASAGAAAGAARAFRAASGMRTTLWRMTSSARESIRWSSSITSGSAVASMRT